MTARILIFLFVSLHLSNYGYSQQYIDSLETQFILVDNVEKLKILDELIPYYFRNEPMQALKSAEKMQGLAMQVGSKE